MKSVLQSVDLSQEYVDSIAKTREESRQNLNTSIFREPMEIYRPVIRRRKARSEKTLVYEKITYSTHNATLCRKSKLRCSDWLSKNIENARPLCEANVRTLAAIASMRSEMVQLSGVAGVEWRCSWSDHQYRLSLRSLLRLYKQQSANLDLKGAEKRVVFANFA